MTPPQEIIKVAADVSELAERVYSIAKQPTTNEDELKHIAERLEGIRDSLNSFEPQKADIPASPKAQTPVTKIPDKPLTIKPAVSPSNPSPLNNEKGGTPAVSGSGNTIDKREIAKTPLPTGAVAAAAAAASGSATSTEAEDASKAGAEINKGLPASSLAGPGEAPAFTGKDQRAPEEKQVEKLGEAEAAGKLPDKDRREAQG